MPISTSGPQPAGNQSITIGLINNMPDAAWRHTEGQFRSLLTNAAPELSICVKLYFVPECRFLEAGTKTPEAYQDVADLWTSGLDALIVTGTEPRADSLMHEPYWGAMTRLVEWAEQHTISTIWSCLAAHAVVLYLDGVARHPLRKKLFGVFECARASDHYLLNQLPSSWDVPHSRWNDLSEEELIRRGYSILARSPCVGADMFLKQRNSLFVFLQGHPEYTPDALFREYRRDVRRFLVGERNHHPDLPIRYFEEQTTSHLRGLQAQALERRDANVLLQMPVAADVRPIRSWQQPATTLYANWLHYIAAQKSRPARPGIVHPPQLALSP
jgi:homoserine O-succinyltransferase